MSFLYFVFGILNTHFQRRVIECLYKYNCLLQIVIGNYINCNIAAVKQMKYKN